MSGQDSPVAIDSDSPAEVDSDSSVEIDESKLPPMDICISRVNEFVEITQTDSALAQFFLQDRDWNLERSVLDYFDSEEGSAKMVTGNAKFVGESAVRTSVPPNKFTFVSWNIDGLDQSNLEARAKEVCRIISQERIDIVFLQEVVQTTVKILAAQLPEYKLIASDNEQYFNVTLLRVFTVYVDSHKVTPLTGTIMGRKLLTVEAHIGKMRLTLMNTHLESTADFASARVQQLKQALKVVADTSPGHNVIFAGDLNLRDKELVLAGKLPAGVDDLWEVCGKRKEVQFTWDLVTNTNKQMPGRYQPRLRFDRAYIRHSDPRVLVPTRFGLVGIDKTPGTQSFPSDHWGIRTWFDITDN